MVNIFANDLSSNGKWAQQMLWEKGVASYNRSNVQILRLPHDTLVYAQFVKEIV